jgi:hypothetical protein
MAGVAVLKKPECKKCISLATSGIWRFTSLSEHIAVDKSADSIRLM